MKIKEFRGKYYFLSNFYDSTVTYDGLTYQNNEAAFQAAKLENNTVVCPKTNKTRKDFTTLPPNKAKALGRRILLRPDWESVKDEVMYDIVKNKFQNNELKTKLLNTKDAELIEGNTWNDTYWGVDIKTGNGRNQLGKTLMKVRKECQ